METIKRICLSAASTAIAILTLGSCHEDGPATYKYETSYYMGGCSGKDNYIYKDGKLLYKLEDNLSLYSLRMTSDGLIACGELTDRPGDWATLKTTAALWKDGKMVDLGLTEDGNSVLECIDVQGDNWACCGREEDVTGIRHGIIVENGKLVYRSEIDAAYQSIAYDTDGNFCVVASDDECLKLLCISSDTKKLLSSKEIAKHDDTHIWSSSSIYISGNDIVLSLDKFDMTDATTDVWYWRNNGKGARYIEEDSEVNSITLYQGNIVAGGSNVTVTRDEQYFYFRKSAVLWVNGEHQDASIGTKPSSTVAAVRNWKDKFLFSCVQAADGVRILSDDLVVEQFPTPSDFIVFGMDVVVNEIPVQ